MEFKIKITLSITNEDIEDIIEMAGYQIGHWAQEAIVKEDAYIILDENDRKHNLTYKDIASGVKLYIENGNKPYDIVSDRGIDTCQVDSEVADMIIQYACFGEVIYG